MKRLLGPARGPAGRTRRAVILAASGVLLTAAAIQPAAAQERERRSFDLVGTVVDEAGRPLVGAFVAPADSEWGSLTGDGGRFILPRTTPGPVTLRAELIGYETLTWTGQVAEGEALILTLAARPIVLEGLNVVTDRFESRRRGIAASVRWFDQKALATSTQPSALDFVMTRAGLTRVRCQGRATNQCVWVRGRSTEPSVYLDEVPIFGGMEYLASVQPHELYMVEVFAGGRHIRAYTPQFMERAAEHRLRPVPLIW